MAASVSPHRGSRPGGRYGGVVGGRDRATGIPRSSFMQVPLAVQSDQLSRGRKVYEELASFAADKLQVEEKTAHAALRASRLGAPDFEISGGTVQEGLVALRRFSVLESRQHSVLARQLQDQFYQPLEKAMSRHADLVMRAKLGVQRSAQLVQESETRLAKAKRQLARAHKDEKGQRDALAKSKNDPRSSQKDVDWLAGKAVRASDTARNVGMSVAGERHQLLQAIRGRDDAVTLAARNFEMAERERVANIAAAMAVFAVRQSEFHAAQMRHLTGLSQAVDAFDPGRDVDSFIEKRRTADNAPLYGVALSLLDWARSVPPPSTSSDDRSHNKNASRTDNDSTAPANAFQSGDGSSSGGVLSVNNSGGGNTADERNAGGTESVVKAVGGVGIIVGSAEESSGVAGAVVNATNVAGGNRDGAPSDGTPPGTGSPPPIKSTNPFDASFVDETDQRVSDTPASDSGDRADSLAPSTMNDNLGREGTLGGDITLGGEGTIDVDALLRQLIPGPQRARVLPTLSGRRLEQVQPVGQDAGVAVAEARVFPSGGDEALDTPAGDEQQELLVAELEGIMVMSKSTSDAALTTAAIAAAAAPSVAPAASVMATAAAIAISAVTPEESGFPGALTGIPTYKGEAGASTAAVPIAVTSQLHNADVAEPKVEEEQDEHAAASIQELRLLVRTEDGRTRFLKALNERRSEATEVTPKAYDALVGILRAFLDGCRPAPAPKDVPCVQEDDDDEWLSSRLSDSDSREPRSGAFIGPSDRRKRYSVGTEMGRKRAPVVEDGSGQGKERRHKGTAPVFSSSSSSGGSSPSTKATPKEASSLTTEGMSQDKLSSRSDTTDGMRGSSVGDDGIVRSPVAKYVEPPAAQATSFQSSSEPKEAVTESRTAAPNTVHTPRQSAPPSQAPSPAPSPSLSSSKPPSPLLISASPGMSPQLPPPPATEVELTADEPVTPRQRPPGSNLLEFAASMLRGNSNRGNSKSNVKNHADTPLHNNNGGRSDYIRQQGFPGGGRDGDGGGGVGTARSGGFLIPGGRGRPGSWTGGDGGGVGARVGRLPQGKGGSVMSSVSSTLERFPSAANPSRRLTPEEELIAAVEVALGSGRRRGEDGLTAGATGTSTVFESCGGGRGDGEGSMDIKSARQAMILANTFYKTQQRSSKSPPRLRGDIVCKRDGSVGFVGNHSQLERRYLLSELRDHDLWKCSRFWDEALMLGVMEQLQEGPASGRWDDLEGEARRDAVARTHNVVFSQLASIAFNMLECGVDGGRVRSDVTRKCKESQLGEMQVQELLRDLDRRIRLSTKVSDETEHPQSRAAITGDDQSPSREKPSSSPALVAAPPATNSGNPFTSSSLASVVQPEPTVAASPKATTHEASNDNMPMNTASKAMSNRSVASDDKNSYQVSATTHAADSAAIDKAMVNPTSPVATVTEGGSGGGRTTAAAGVASPDGCSAAVTTGQPAASSLRTPLPQSVEAAASAQAVRTLTNDAKANALPATGPSAKSPPASRSAQVIAVPVTSERTAASHFERPDLAQYEAPNVGSSRSDLTPPHDYGDGGSTGTVSAERGSARGGQEAEVGEHTEDTPDFERVGLTATDEYDML